jgi:NADH dehydrogenase
LAHRAVEVRLNTRVEQITPQGVVAGGEFIPSRVVIWCAGVKASPVAVWLGAEPTRHGTVRVHSDFSIDGHANVFVIGDAADARKEDGRSLPKLAATAKQQGEFLGAVINHRLAGEQTHLRFRYRDFGAMATIGRSAAVADIRGVQLKGAAAWVLWGAVHIFFLIGFRNRVVVLVKWFWAWLTHSRGARLILSSAIRGSHDDASTRTVSTGTRT